MKKEGSSGIEEARNAAVEVLIHNSKGPFLGLPRTAGWGYPEPYTRDLMIASLGILVSDDDRLIASLRQTLTVLAENQTRLGHIPSLVHDPKDCGASDSTPLFLIAAALFRKKTCEPDFLEEPIKKSLAWMEYQSPDDLVMVTQDPTSDWRDEHWVPGYGLYVNTLVYIYLMLFGQTERAEILKDSMNRLDIRRNRGNKHIHEGLVVAHKPYYALWSYKTFNNERFDLLGNSLAILSGIASPSRAGHMISWVEDECESLKERKVLALDLPPCLIPYMQTCDPDWRTRYKDFNLPGEYHNGGVWPFICGFYIAALVAVGRRRLAKKKLDALTETIRKSRDGKLSFGFNEWLRAQDGFPRGQDWQTWSAAMYLYAAAAVERGETPFFDVIRKENSRQIK